MQTPKLTLHLVSLVFAFILSAFPVNAEPLVVDGSKVEAQVVDINLASAAELMQLKRVGDKKAQAIIRYRELNGPFEQVDDLAKVKGIGEKIIEINRSRLLVAH